MDGLYLFRLFQVWVFYMLKKIIIFVWHSVLPLYVESVNLFIHNAVANYPSVNVITLYYTQQCTV